MHERRCVYGDVQFQVSIQQWSTRTSKDARNRTNQGDTIQKEECPLPPVPTDLLNGALSLLKGRAIQKETPHPPGQELGVF